MGASSDTLLLHHLGGPCQAAIMNFNVMKKVRKLSRKGKLLIDDQNLDEKKEMISALTIKTNKSPQEITEAYDKFHREYPKGSITREAYISSTKDYVLNDALFRVFDEDDSGTLNFFEWFQASNVKNMTSVEEKLHWIFTAFDADGGGSIDSDEIMEIVKWMFRFAGIEEDPDLLASCVIDVRATIDQDEDGDISKEEFIKNSMNSPFIAEVLKERKKRV